MKLATTFATMILLACALSAFAQGEGPPDEGLTQPEVIQWLVNEIGSSVDGLTVRESINATDEIMSLVIQTLTEEEQEALPNEVIQEARDRAINHALLRFVVLPALFVIIGILFWLGVEVRSLRRV